MIWRFTIVGDDLSFFCDNQTVSGIIKNIIKKHLTKGGHIIRATKCANDSAITAYRNTQDHTCLLINTAVQWITESCLAFHGFQKIFSLGYILYGTVVIVCCTVCFDQGSSFEIRVCCQGYQKLHIFIGKNIRGISHFVSDTVQKSVMNIENG